MNRMKAIGMALALVAASVAGAQTLYVAGQGIKDQGISVRGWGSGSVAETDEVAYEGTTSVRISTRNYFQGGRILFDRPVDLTSAFADKNNLLLIMVRLADDAVTPPSGGGRQGEEGGGKGGGLTMGGGRGQESNQPPTMGGGGSDAPRATLKRLRVIVTTTDGKKSEAFVDIPTRAGERGWRRVGVPLQAISGLAETNKTVSEIAVSGDATATFFIGEMRILKDESPIFGQVSNQEINLGIGSEVTLWASGEGGASQLKYSWDFDAADGSDQVDAEGQVVRRRFRKPGDFTITVRISDVYGLKQPWTTTIKVTVNP